MNRNPQISVIVPVFNAAAHVPVAVACLERQRWPGLELILVDSSTDGSSGAVRAAAPAARYVYQERRGPGAARNAGLALASGPWIAFLDVDDAWPDDALAVMAAALEAHPAALFVLGRTAFEPADTEPWVSPNFGAGLYRREVFARAGLLPEDRPYGEDVEWFLRVREAGLPYVTVDHVTLRYRRRAGSHSAGLSWRKMGLASIIRASLARRREAGARARELPLLSGSPDDPRATGPVSPP
jgi:glycosyltransferase involved in cell wall biosynthesis